jgi:Raf kinase inhibitor-like YbhB/YbcL family protein
MGGIVKPGAKLIKCLFFGVVALSVIAIALPACEPEEVAPPGEEEIPKEEEMMLSVSSPAFQEGERIPVKYTCKGEDVSPPLAWGEPPAGTQFFTLIVDDPDAPGGVFTHWVLFNIPSHSFELPEAIPTQAELPSGALQGRNDFGRIGYGGPCPPPGSPHRYQFILYAVEQPLDLKAGVSKKQVLSAMQGHILAEGQLVGTYQR